MKKNIRMSGSERNPSESVWILRIVIVLSSILMLINSKDAFTGLGGWNESHYSIGAKNLFSKNNPFEIEMHMGRLNFYVPPVFTWFLYSSFYLFGVGELQARIVSILAAQGTIFFTHRLGREFFDEKTANLATILLASYPIFILYGRNVQTDPLFLFFFISSLYIYVKNSNKSIVEGKGSKKNYILFLILTWLCIMTKQIGIMIIPFIIIYDFIKDIELREIRHDQFKIEYLLNTKIWIKILFFALIAILPYSAWYIYTSIVFPEDFNYFMGTNNQIYLRNEGYIPFILRQSSPLYLSFAILLICNRIMYTLKRNRKTMKNRSNTMLLLTSSLSFLFLLLVQPNNGKPVNGIRFVIQFGFGDKVLLSLILIFATILSLGILGLIINNFSSIEFNRLTSNHLIISLFTYLWFLYTLILHPFGHIYYTYPIIPFLAILLSHEIIDQTQSITSKFNLIPQFSVVSFIVIIITYFTVNDRLSYILLIIISSSVLIVLLLIFWMFIRKKYTDQENDKTIISKYGMKFNKKQLQSFLIILFVVLNSVTISTSHLAIHKWDRNYFRDAAEDTQSNGITDVIILSRGLELETPENVYYFQEKHIINFEFNNSTINNIKNRGVTEFAIVNIVSISEYTNDTIFELISVFNLEINSTKIYYVENLVSKLFNFESPMLYVYYISIPPV